MNLTAMKKRLYIIASVLAAITACSEKNELSTPLELGVKQQEVTLPCTAGSYYVEVLADGEFTLSLPSDATWLSIGGERSISGHGDSRIELSYEMNRGLQRTAVLHLSRGKKDIGIEITQQGILSSGIEFGVRSITAGAEAGRHSAKITTLCKDSDLLISVSYKGQQGWISDFEKSNNYLVFGVIENASEENRIAEITVSSKSDPALSDVLQICQLGSGISLNKIAFDELEGIAGSAVSGSGSYLEGVVISDNSEGNGAPNLNISASLQDNTLADRTVYIQAADGSAGVKVIFDSQADNILRRYDSVRLLLDGTTVIRHSDPVHYEIRGVGTENLLYTEAGNSLSVPEKKKRMSELTDADIHTFVTITDCEIPIRKGPFFPIDLRHTYVINRYPMVIRDIEGSTMHLMSNITASWQRDGKGLPEGSGEISGVLVHETCDNFNWDSAKAMAATIDGVKLDYVTEIGDIGKYQIRPLKRSEIKLGERFEDGFSGLLMEVRYYNKSHNELVVNVKSNTIYSTYPAVEFPLTDPSVKGVLETVGSDGNVAGVAAYRDWTLLGPMENGELTNASCGNGVYDFFGNSAHWNVYSLASTTGLLLDANGSAWYCTGWSEKKSWRATFSTEGLTEANFPLSVQFGAVAGLGETVGAPRYWVIEYSADGSVWTKFGEYTVPDFPILSNRKAWQCPGPKYMSFTLPEDSSMLGKEKVYVRMHPANTKAGTPNSYDDGEIVSTCTSEMNYFAIRYNK